MSASPSSAPAQDQPRQALCRATCMSSLCFGNVSCLGTARSGSPGPVQLAEGTKLGATGLCQGRTKPCSTDTGSKPLPTSLGPSSAAGGAAAECSAVWPDEGIATSRTQWEQWSTCVLLPSSTGSLPNSGWLCTCCPSTAPRVHPPDNSPRAARSPRHILTQKPQPDPSTHLY